MRWSCKGRWFLGEVTLSDETNTFRGKCKAFVEHVLCSCMTVVVASFIHLEDISTNVGSHNAFLFDVNLHDCLRWTALQDSYGRF